MGRTMNRLTVRRVEQRNDKGICADGNGLYLRVVNEHSKSWSFVWHEGGKRREMGLGSALPGKVSLAEARQKAEKVRSNLANHVDPRGERAPAKPSSTFGEVADAFIQDRKDSVKSKKSEERWERCIGVGGYADALRKLTVDSISTDDVVNVLRPLWHSRPHSAGLLRGYIENVLAKARVEGRRAGENPAVWKGQLEFVLPKRKRLSRGHHAALPYEELPCFMGQLVQQGSMAASALQLTILTATRTSEALHAKWEEFDLDRALWTITDDRMKAGKEHRIPLSKPVLALLRGWGPSAGLVFPGRKPGRPLSGMAMEMVLRRMVDNGQLMQKITVHGFRSTFRDWAGEMTDTPREVCEAALAHTVGNSAELAYRRGDALEKRRVLMETWAAYCCDPSFSGAASKLVHSA